MPYSPEFRAKAIALREDHGLTHEQIARVLGISQSTAHVWTTPYAALKRRERYVGHPIVARECVGYACHVVIAAEEKPNKVYCSLTCKRRAADMRRQARQWQVA